MFHSFHLLSTINEFSKKSTRSWSSSVFSISFRGIQNGLWQVEINRCYLGMLLACLLHDWQKEEIEKIQLIKSVRATKYAWLWFIGDTKLRGVGGLYYKAFLCWNLWIRISGTILTKLFWPSQFNVNRLGYFEISFHRNRLYSNFWAIFKNSTFLSDNVYLGGNFCTNWATFIATFGHTNLSRCTFM